MMINLKNRNRFLFATALLLAGLLLLWANSLGHYLDPWVKGMFKGRMSYWFVVAGIGFILASIIMFIPVNHKAESPHVSSGNRM